MKNIILASASPRRREILGQVGVEFQVIPSNREEIITKSKPIEIVRELATMKSHEVYEQTQEPVIVIGADTIVVHNNEIMGKPKEEEDAKRMLRGIQDNTHEVYTGVSILIRDYDMNNQLMEKELSFEEATKVSIYPMNEDDIEAYVATKEPMDKAGAYAIQGEFAIYVKKIDGDYYNVVGLPVARIFQELRKIGIDLLQ